MKLIKLVYTLWIILLIPSIYADENTQLSQTENENCIIPASTEYHPIKSNNDIITFTKVKSQDTYNHGEEEIRVYRTNCNTEKGSAIDRLPYTISSNQAKIAEAFFYKDTLIILYQYPFSSKTVLYTSDQYRTYAYQKDKTIYFDDDKVHAFLSNGADIVESNGDGYVYPYKTKEAIIKGLSSNLYKRYTNNEQITGEITKRTKLQPVNTYFAKTKIYAEKGMEFKVDKISAGWLNIEYLDSNKKVSNKWVMCKDTSLCKENGEVL